VSELLTPEHLGALAAISLFCVAAVIAARKIPGAWIKALAVVLVVDEVSWWVYLLAGGQPGSRLAWSLPLQLCDAGIFVAGFALWFRRRWLVEVTYFWGLTGTLQALLTPDLPQHFPTYPYFQYYIAHGGVVAAALLLVFGLGLRPRRSAVARVTAITVAYVAFVGLVDSLTGANYMYLRSKPPPPTLLDVMGPWPWYIVAASLIALVLFFALDVLARVASTPGPPRADGGPPTTTGTHSPLARGSRGRDLDEFAHSTWVVGSLSVAVREEGAPLRGNQLFRHRLRAGRPVATLACLRLGSQASARRGAGVHRPGFDAPGLACCIHCDQARLARTRDLRAGKGWAPWTSFPLLQVSLDAGRRRPKARRGATPERRRWTCFQDAPGPAGKSRRRHPEADQPG
jgi:hypothetical integral membrane protein (TIGR02206 family)